MKLRFLIPVLNVEVFRIELDIERDGPEEVTVVDKAAKATSKWFFSRMVRG